jgi:selenide,water dikinase
MSKVKLTQYSHGAGCGCKISPGVLSQMLVTTQLDTNDSCLIVGNKSRDDAAVYDLGDGTGVISTTDFFMPIVDDPFTFGKIAATNAISDVYAMGGDPMLAIAILGWPIDKLPPEVARQVLEGARATCAEAGITMAGGHSIDSPEPIFGLAVTGRVSLKKLKRNDTASAGCRLYLTKPLGVGIFSTAQKQGKLLEEHTNLAPDSMTILNRIGTELADIDGIRAMTDVTGFGLLGHLVEMCEGSGLSADIEFDKVPVFEEVTNYITQNCIPGGTYRNWDSYGDVVRLKDESDKLILCDPQTSGGLMIAVEEDSADEVEAVLKSHDVNPVPFGHLIPRTDVLIRVL